VAKQTTSTADGKATARGGSSPARATRPATARAGEAVQRRQAASLVTFFQESRAELRKVTWPTRQETLNLTGAVIAMTVGLAAFLGIIDKVLDLIISPLIGAK
jgi:preprotein translocase subunit SecE